MHQKVIQLTLAAVLLSASFSSAGNVPGVGHPAPDFTLASGDETFQLAELEGESPVLLIFFRGLW